MAYPYTTAFAENKASETVFYCVECAKELSDNPVDDFMDIPYDSSIEFIRCRECGTVVRDLDS